MESISWGINFVENSQPIFDYPRPIVSYKCMKKSQLIPVKINNKSHYHDLSNHRSNYRSSWSPHLCYQHANSIVSQSLLDFNRLINIIIMLFHFVFLKVLNNFQLCSSLPLGFRQHPPRRALQLLPDRLWSIGKCLRLWLLRPIREPQVPLINSSWNYSCLWRLLVGHLSQRCPYWNRPKPWQ